MSNRTRFSTRPLYLQVRDAIVQNIATGLWAPGALIPNEVELAREFGVSLGSMRKALAEVESENLLVRKQGRGTSVVDQQSESAAIRFSAFTDSTGRKVFGSVLNATLTRDTANETEAARLSLRPGEPVLRIHRTRAWQGRVFAVDELTLPSSRYANLGEADMEDCRMAVIAQKNGILLANAVEDVSSVPSDPVIAGKLSVEPGTPLLRMDRVMLDIYERPVEYRITHCHLDTLIYRTRIV